MADEREVDVTNDALYNVAIDAIESFADLHDGKGKDIVLEIIDLVMAKNKDYGNAWQRYGIFTPLIRINDKILRVSTLSDGREAMVAAESIEDTLRDIIGYAMLALIWLQKFRRSI